MSDCTATCLRPRQAPLLEGKDKAPLPEVRPGLPRYDLTRVIQGDYQQMELPYLPPNRSQTPSTTTTEQLQQEIVLEQYRRQKRRLAKWKQKKEEPDLIEGKPQW